MKNYLLPVLVIVTCTSCSSTRLMSLSVLEPAPVTLPPGTKNVGIINRSLASNNGKILDVVDKVFTLEGANLDKDGSKASISALENELNLSKRFSTINNIDYSGPGNNTPGMYPTPLAWDKVSELCKLNNVDVLFSLELFDTDSKISYSAIPTRVNTPLGSVPMIHQEATMRTQVKTGWRIYDPVSKQVLDEAALSRFVTFTGRGVNPVMAANALIARKDAVKQVGHNAGSAYAYRVIPSWLRVSRWYYVRGNRMFKVARRKAEGGNWDGAGEIWKEQTASPKRKVAGRAYYNLAIISEINGDLDQAVKWAQTSYENYNIRLALRYIRVLEGRKYRNKILEEQNDSVVKSQQ